MSWDWEKLRQQQRAKRKEEEPIIIARTDGSAIGHAVGDWLERRLKISIVWALSWRLAVYLLGWIMAGVLIRVGFDVYDYIAAMF